MATNCMKVIYNSIVNLVVVELACLGPACLTFTTIKLDKASKKTFKFFSEWISLLNHPIQTPARPALLIC